MNQTARTIRLLIADDHALVRQGLIAVLSREPDFAVVGEAANGAEAVTQYLAMRPDVVLMDCRMPHLDGVSAIARLRSREPGARIVLISAFGGEDDIYDAMRAGANGYLLKDGPLTELGTCIREVHAGRNFLPSVVASRLADRLQGSELTPRERDVLALMALGRSNRDIATALTIGLGTVKGHINAIFDKLGASGRTEAVTIALRRGLVRFP